MTIEFSNLIAPLEDKRCTGCPQVNKLAGFICIPSLHGYPKFSKLTNIGDRPAVINLNCPNEYTVTNAQG